MSWWSALDNGSTRGRTGGVGGSSALMEAIAIDSLRNSEPWVEHGANSVTCCLLLFSEELFLSGRVTAVFCSHFQLVDFFFSA